MIMTTQPTATPTIPSDNSGSAKTTDGNVVAEEGGANDISPKSVFVNSESIREDQVRNAVIFLSHPKVRGSPVIHRRNFLERKGLTKEEIDEAFRRVPDPSPLSTSAQDTDSKQDGQLDAATRILQPAHIQVPQPVTTPYGTISTLTGQFHWPNVTKEVAAAAKVAAASAAADVARASQQMLVTKTEEKKHFQEFMILLEEQLQEIKSMKSAIIKLEESHKTAKQIQVEEEHPGGSLACSKQIGDSMADFDSRSARSSSAAASAEPAHPKSFMEIMAMVERGEKPPNIREINDLPPNPNQEISNPTLAPRPKPWEVTQRANSSSSSFTAPPPFINRGSSTTSQTNGVSYQSNDDSPLPWWQQKNTTITEIESENSFRAPTNGSSLNDPLHRKWLPPQLPPVAHPEAALAIRQPKPSAAKDRVVDDVSSSLNVNKELDRITEVSESGGQNANGGGSGMSSAGEKHTENPAENSFIMPSNGEAAIDPPPQLWQVPSLPSRVAISEAVLGIEQLKSSTAKDCLVDDVSSPLNEIEELDRITNISESDGQKANSRGSDVSEVHSKIETRHSFVASSDGKIDIDLLPQLQRVPSPPPAVAVPEVALSIEQPKSSAERDHLINGATLPLNEVDELDRITNTSESGRQKQNEGGSEMSSYGKIQTEIEIKDRFVAASNLEAVIDLPPQLQRVPSPAPPVALPEAALGIEQPESASLVNHLETDDCIVASSDCKAATDPSPQFQQVPSPSPPVAVPEAAIAIQQPE
ncbi:Peroxisomal membrane protein PEX14-like protein [Drosera capensis]